MTGVQRKPEIPVMTGAVSVEVGDEELILDHRGIVFLPAWNTLVVSDLHLEKGACLARRGALVPPYDTIATLHRLAALVAEYNPSMVICLGDSFHDNEGAARMVPEYREALEAVMAGRDWIWISGNHDSEGTDCLPGTDADEIALGAVMLRHVPLAGACDEISGHLHPGARIVQRGRSVRRRCFATDGVRLVMPAFGTFTGTLNVLDPAYDGLFDKTSMRTFLLGARQLHEIRPQNLRAG